jgi:AcrR family transcriptional regulator
MSPRSKKLSEQMKAESRKAILEASLELFAKKGFSATTTDEIAKKAKVSKGLIFSHFSSKEDLLINIMDDALERWFHQFDVTDDDRPPKEKFISFIDSWLHLITTDPYIVRLGLQLNLDDEYRKVVTKKGSEYLERFFGRMKKLLKQLGSKHPDLDCYLLMFFFDGVTANYTVAPELFPIDAIKNHFIDILFSKWKNTK